MSTAEAMGEYDRQATFVLGFVDRLRVLSDELNDQRSANVDHLYSERMFQVMIMVERVLVAAATEPTGDTEGDQMSMQGVIKHLATTAIESQKERMAQAAVELAEAQMAGDKSAVAVYANTFTAAEMLIRDTSFLVD